MDAATCQRYPTEVGPPKPSLPPERIWPFIWVGIWAALGLALVVRTGIRDRGVITDHLEFGRRLLHGLDLYAPYLDPGPLHPPYPPSFALLTAPFSLLPERLARFAWGILQVGALLGIGVSLKSVLTRWAPALRPHLHLLLFGTALVCSRYILRDTHGGGGNLINLALCLLAYTAANRSRPGCAGLLLGVSLATKPTQVLLLPLFALFGYRQAVAWACVTAVSLALTSLCLLRFDTSAWERWISGSLAYASTTDLFATPDLGFPPFTWMNQCLRCMTSRYLGTVPAGLAAEVPGFFPGLGWEGPAIAWVSRGASLGVLATTLAVALRRRAPIHQPPLLSAVLVLSLLLSPISWKAHHVVLIPAFFLLLCRGIQGARWAWITAALYVLTCSIGGDILGRGATELQLSLYLFTLWDVVLWALCLALCRRQSATSSELV